MIDAERKANMITALETNFPTIDIRKPPNFVDTVTFSTIIRYINQDTLDEILVESPDKIVIGYEFPRMDIPFARVISDQWGRDKTHVLESQVPPGAGDWITVVGATTASFTFTTTEPTISRISIYTQIPVGTTSWLNFVLTDEFGNVLVTRKIFTTHCLDPGWVDINVGLTVRLNPNTGVSRPYTVTISEDVFGSNPIGIDIGKDGANIAYRLYYYKVGLVQGKLARGTMRINVFARDKRAGREPDTSVFVGKQDIVMQAVDQIRQYIWANWTTYGLNDIGQTIEGSGESSDSVPFHANFFDVFITIQDLGTPETPQVTLKQIEFDIKGE